MLNNVFLSGSCRRLEAVCVCVVGEGLHRLRIPAFVPVSEISLVIIICGDVGYKLRAVLIINYFKIVPIIVSLLLQKVVVCYFSFSRL